MNKYIFNYRLTAAFIIGIASATETNTWEDCASLIREHNLLVRNILLDLPDNSTSGEIQDAFNEKAYILNDLQNKISKVKLRPLTGVQHEEYLKLASDFRYGQMLWLDDVRLQLKRLNYKGEFKIPFINHSYDNLNYLREDTNNRTLQLWNKMKLSMKEMHIILSCVKDTKTARFSIKYIEKSIMNYEKCCRIYELYRYFDSEGAAATQSLMEEEKSQLSSNLVKEIERIDKQHYFQCEELKNYLHRILLVE